MKTTLAAIALAATLAQPAGAVTFPSLTTIYVGAGVFDNGGDDDTGEATSILCANVSGVTVSVRALILDNVGVQGSLTVFVSHGQTQTFSTHSTAVFPEASLETGAVQQGIVNIEATNSAVFCSAHIVDAQNAKPVFMSPIHLVRVNPHPGTVE
jgi:hypothetical protein